jgi:hypothetical protein
MRTAIASSRRSTVSQRLKRNLPVGTPLVYAYSGAPVSIVVPPTARSMVVDLSGGGGGDFRGAKGGRLQATLQVTPGETLQLRVGGKGVDGSAALGGVGGYNGGGSAPVSGSDRAGSGGGATDISRVRGYFNLTATKGFRATNTTQTPTGDQDWRVKIDLTTYTPASEQDLVSKFPATGADTASFLFAIKATGKLRAWWLESGGTTRDVESTVTLSSVGIVPGLPVRLRVTITMATGTVKFWYSVDNGTTWLQLGADVVVGASNMATSTAKLAAGNYDGFVGGIAGKLYEASIHSSIGGAILAQFKAESASAGTYVAPTGETWTPIGSPVYATVAADRIAIAGGGGGQGGNSGVDSDGHGGGLVGATSTSWGGQGGGGTQSAGGAGGASNGLPGSLGQGGNGIGSGYNGGGGGGGYYGGGGGSGSTSNGSGRGGDGGGGSSYIDSAAVAVTHTQGYTPKQTHGAATITFSASAIPITGFAHRGHQIQDLSAGATVTSAMAVTVAGGGTLCAIVRADNMAGGVEAPIGPTMTGLGGTWVNRGTTHQWPGSSCKAYLFTCTDYTAGAGTITVNFPALGGTGRIAFVVDEILGGKTVVQTKMLDFGGASGGVSAVSLDTAPDSNSFVWGYFAVGNQSTYAPRVRPGFNTVGLFDSVNFPSHGLPGMLTAYELGTNTLDFDLGGSSNAYRNVGAVEIAA